MTLIEPISNARQKTGLSTFGLEGALSVYPFLWPLWKGNLAVLESTAFSLFRFSYKAQGLTASPCMSKQR